MRFFRLAANSLIHLAATVLLISLVPTAAVTETSPPLSTDELSRTWTFDSDMPDMLPKDFEIGTLFDGRVAGDWKVLKTDRAMSSPHVLAQVMGKGAEHAYKTVLVKNLSAADLNLEVSFLAISGNADMGGGLIWRADGDRNYYLTRANPLEQNIRIYRVVKGVRHMLLNFDQTIDVKQWHTLGVVTRGCTIQVLYDEKEVFNLCDETFKAGRIGLWTKSDAVTYFDNFRLQAPK